MVKWLTALICTVTFVTSAVGCRVEPDLVDQSAAVHHSDRKSQATATRSALSFAKQAAKQARWEEAEQQIERALIENPQSPEVIQVAAEIAFANNEPQRGTALLVEACSINEYRDTQMVEKTTKALLSIGDFYKTIELLTTVVSKFPDRAKTKRRLFDFLINAEEAALAKPYGIQLVRDRQFDGALLFAMGTHERRAMEGDSMAILSSRNPDDPRLLISDVRIQFDDGQWDELEATLDRILSFAPRCVPAQTLLGRLLVERREFDRLIQWSDRVTPRTKTTWQYWCVLGDWAFSRQQYQQAARAYWESTRRNFDVAEIFAKLAQTLFILRSNGEMIDQLTIEATLNRAELLNRFVQSKDQFYKSGKRSNASIADMAHALEELGRYWEAEAWAAFAMTIPDENVIQVETRRKSVLGKLNSNTPWQSTDGYPVFEIDLSHFPIPELGVRALPEKPFMENMFRPSVKPVLRDEARKRGLIAESKTGRRLDNVIPLYAQMDSGGCAIDVDRDGWSDLYVASSGGLPGRQDSDSNSLFRNTNGIFTNITDFANADDRGFAQGVSFGDVNADGFHDILVLNYGFDQLLINNGDGTFTKSNGWLPKRKNPSWSTSGAIADLNADGLADLVCVKYCKGMEPVTVRCGGVKQRREEPCVPTKFAAQRDLFLECSLTGGFADATKSWSMLSAQPGRGLGIIVGALDSSTGNDVFIANDMTANHLWTTSFNDRFEMVESATLRGLAFDHRHRPQACMGIATGDFDDDGDVDLFVTNFEQEHNTFYGQTKNGVWSDQTRQRGLMSTSFFQLGFGAQAIDFDNDSLDEIAITNGHIDRNAKAPSNYEQTMQILRRISSTEFDAFEFPRDDGYLSQAHVGRALWKLDVDRDGRVDLAVTHQTEPTSLLMNRTTTSNRWLKLYLVGVLSERDAIGASIAVEHNGERRIVSLTSGDGFFCGNERVLHVGLGEERGVASEIKVTVTWPGGVNQEVTAEPNGEYLIIEGLRTFDLPH